MICPRCRVEYQPEIEICADCGVALVTDVQAISHSQDPDVSVGGDFGIIYVTSDSYEVNVIKGLLESNGVLPFIFNESTFKLNPFFNNALGDIKIYVHSTQRLQAIEILKEYQASHEENIETNSKIIEEPKTPSTASSVDSGSSTKICSVCSRQGAPDSNFCDQCGQPFAPDPEKHSDS